MITRAITITLPDDIAQAAEARGLLTSDALEQLIRAEVGRHEHQRLRTIMDDLASIKEPPRVLT